jgi:phenylalanyl-tRNA synthetase beta chain
MKISLNWISDFVALPVDLDVRQVAHDLTMSTVEVEAVTYPATQLTNVKVGQIRSVESISPSLTLVKCDVGRPDSLQILSTANEIRAGMLVAVALPSARIIQGNGTTETVQPHETAGLRSDAVLCSAAQLSLQDLFPQSEDRILDLSETHAAPGADLSEALGWNGVVLEIDNKSLTHRPDLWGHYGLARELAAIYSCELLPLPESSSLLRWTGDLLSNIDPACSRFTATRIKQVKHAKAPLWLRSRLALIGQRSVSALVDLSNYVMFATGQPTHVFDAARVALPLGVRRALPKEHITLLDERSYSLDPSMIVVADKNGPVALAGVMGGADSAVADGTDDIILEIANFDPVIVRKASTRLSLRSEASTRYEKGLDTQRVGQARALFLDILQKIHPSSDVTEFSDQDLRPTQQKEILVRGDFLRARLGKPLPNEEMAQLLVKIGFDVESKSDEMKITVPSWRSTGDVSIAQDIVEEVARLHGYERFEFVPPRIDLIKKSFDRTSHLERSIKEILAFTGGMREVVSYPWIDDRYLTAAGFDGQETLQLSAPPAPDQSRLRPSLVPGLLKCSAINERFFDSFGIFEAGEIFQPRDYRSLDSVDEVLPLQRRHLGGAFVGKNAGRLFLEAKGLIETVQHAAHIDPVSFEPASPPRWAERDGFVRILSANKPIGELGIATTRAKKLADLKRSDVVLFELDLEAIRALPSRENRFSKINEFPEVEVDLSLVISNEVKWVQLVRELEDHHHELIKQVDFIDEYRGKGIPEGSRSITIRLKLGSEFRTLTADEAKEVSAEVVNKLTSAFGAMLRN